MLRSALLVASLLGAAALPTMASANGGPGSSAGSTQQSSSRPGKVQDQSKCGGKADVSLFGDLDSIRQGTLVSSRPEPRPASPQRTAQADRPASPSCSPSAPVRR